MKKITKNPTKIDPENEKNQKENQNKSKSGHNRAAKRMSTEMSGISYFEPKKTSMEKVVITKIKKSTKNPVKIEQETEKLQVEN